MTNEVGMARTLKRWCGPAAVASAMGWGRRRAARRILAARKKLGHPLDRFGKDKGTTTITELALAMGGLRVQFYARAGWDLRHTCLTLAQWLRDHPDREAVLRCTSHFLHVKDGEVVEDNGKAPRRGRVTHVVYLD